MSDITREEWALLVAKIDSLERTLLDAAPMIQRAAVDVDVRREVEHINALRRKGATAQLEELAAKREQRERRNETAGRARA